MATNNIHNLLQGLLAQPAQIRRVARPTANQRIQVTSGVRPFARVGLARTQPSWLGGTRARDRPRRARATGFRRRERDATQTLPKDLYSYKVIRT